ncbi:MAG: CRISPR-associated helicase Cas3', partial [Candidatus Helarchaeota archaeon]
MFSFKLLARPGELLVEHSERVADLSIKRFKDYSHNLSIILDLEGSILENLVYTTGFSHDFGKATSYFQEYIKADNEEKQKLKNQPETHHGLLSAVFTYWLIKSYFKIKDITSKNSFLPFLPFLFFLMVKKHHGNLEDPINDELFSQQYDYLEYQIRELDKKEIEQLLSFLSKKVNVNFRMSEFPVNIKSFIKNEFRSQIKPTSIRKKFLKEFPDKIENYITFQFFYSILLQSDKESIVIEKRNKKRPRISTDIVRKFKKKKFGEPRTRIDQIREEIFIDSHRTINETDLSQNIFSLNVPTGSGKTLTALSVALRLRERLEKEKGFIPRIIYSLPFTSIIDQNYDVFHEVLNNPSSELLLKHHHLSELFYKSRNDDEYDTNQSQFLIESWESEIVVTTFIQLFHTLLSNKNRALKKFHKLANSIILLDEVQTIPIKYWLLIRAVLSKICDVFNTYIILMTATQPRIFPGEKIVELVPDKDKYFGKLNRVHLSFEKKDFALNDFEELILLSIIDSSESFLIVLNTINSSLHLYNFLIKKEIDRNVLFYLSTNIIPKHRTQRIRRIRDSRKKKIIISTQMVEAGVDIDVENVWRDFGPLDSINQICGRCNRNFGDRLGNVKIFQLKNEEGNYFYKYIYGDSPLSLIETINSFKGKTSFDENEFLKNIDNYYQKIEENMSNVVSENVIENVKKLRFDKISKFRLIENDDYYKKDVFIEYDEKAKEAWGKFIRIRKSSIFERKLAFK